jgi:hypothetical protein
MFFRSLFISQEHCKAVGDYLLTEMRVLQKKHNGGASLPLHFCLIIVIVFVSVALAI